MNLTQWQLIQSLSAVRLEGVQFVDRMVRGEAWLFIHNDISGQHMRINGLARQLVWALDGTTPLSECVSHISEHTTADELEAVSGCLVALTQHGMISLCDSSAQARLQLRLEQLSRRTSARWQNPLAVKFALLNPDRMIGQLVGWCHPFAGRSLLLWVLSVIGIAIIAALFNIDKLTVELSRVATTPQHWWKILVLYPFLKCAHELAHALVIKKLGGFVHEMGISLLVLMPLPYVDASDSWRFEKRRERILVSAAGMLAEGFLAAVGLLVWLVVVPGLVSDLAFSIALMGSVSTILFNANPLLRFDGYQILQDLLDIPNLGTRSNSYLQYLARRYVLGVMTAKSPVSGNRERRWLVSYAIGSTVYRWIITLGIALYLTRLFPVAGALLALFALHQIATRPVMRLITYLRTSAELAGHRSRACGVTLCTVCVLLGSMLLVPLPYSTRTEGVVGLSQQAQLYSPQSGELTKLYVKPGQLVTAGQAIAQLSAPDLHSRLAKLNSQLSVLELDHHAALFNDPAAAYALREDLEEKHLERNRLEQSVDELLIRAAVDGRIVMSPMYEYPGQYVQAGSALGHIVNDNDLRIKAVVRQNDVSRLYDDVQDIRIRLAERSGQPIPATLVQQTPAGNRRLPSQALAFNGRSGIAVASDDTEQWKTIEPVFHLEFGLPAEITTAGIGGRAFITLAHRPESIGKRSWRALRQLLLNQLAI